MHDNNYAVNISSFVRWAHERIAKEIESNDKCEAEHGSSSISDIRSRISYKLTDKEKLEYINHIDSLRSKYTALGFRAICKKAGIHDQTYYKWRKSLNLGNYKRKKK
jgi:hypothetical protein